MSLLRLANMSLTRVRSPRVTLVHMHVHVHMRTQMQVDSPAWLAAWPDACAIYIYGIYVLQALILHFAC